MAQTPQADPRAAPETTALAPANVTDVGVSIRRILAVDESRIRVIEMHSVRNALTQAHNCLWLADGGPDHNMRAEDCAFGPSIRRIGRLVSLLGDRQGFAEELMRSPRLEDVVALDAALRFPNGGMDGETAELLATFDEIWKIGYEQLKELADRWEHGDGFRNVPAATIRSGLEKVFSAIARNSGGRFGVAFSPERKTPGDYLLTTRFVTPDGGATVMIPSSFLDVCRDLLANARKYSDPGTEISLEIVQDHRETRIRVQDAGRGIPAEEVEKVVDDGYRASNVQDVRGLGYGLTKAYLLCQKYDGEFSIKSKIGAGTRITITLPLPT